MKVALIGTGAMGCIFGAALARSGVDLVCLDQRHDVVAALQQYGMRVRGVLGEQTIAVRATSDPAQLGAADMALVLVDALATPAAADIARACLKPDGFALSLQNGIGNLEALVEALGPQRVMAGVTYNSGTGEGPARSWHTHLGLTTMGEATGAITLRLQALAERFRAQGMAVELTGQVEAAIWSKFVHNCAINPISALTGLRPAQIMQTPPAQALMEHVIDEILLVVAAMGIVLPEHDPRGEILNHCRERMNQPSMLQHLLAGKPTEIGALNEALLARAGALGLAVPFNTAVVLAIRALEANAGPILEKCTK
jgi:2-dehydropantoate 2-reductase